MATKNFSFCQLSSSGPAQAPVQTVHRTRPRATEGLALPEAARFRKQLAVPKASQFQEPRSTKSLAVPRAS
ncbi:hypothetical protein DERF_002648 [Dermatophagoides farinae]|uniref:Uncharacterized protein n=1 Tax=Dermatophagoides farinae TaxID=6954 RepID=A0A922LDD2_DERFA|nr:hypothetical protein DERF_002648 [Dermatophagoides farinae]